MWTCFDGTKLSCMLRRQQHHPCVHSGAEEEATSPNLLCGFLHIQPGQSLRTEFVATSQAFFVIRRAPSLGCSLTASVYTSCMMTQPAIRWRAPAGNISF